MQIDLRSLIIQTVWLWNIVLKFSLIFNCINWNCINLSQIVLIVLNIVKMSFILIIFVEIFHSVWLVSMLMIFVSRWYYICFNFPHLQIWQSLLWKLDLDSCFRFSDWSFILLNGNFIQFLVLTVVCFVLHHVLLFPQIEIGFKIVI